VLWQAVFVTSASLLVGLPTGVAIGRWAWSRIIADLGVVAPPRVDLAHVALVIPVALVLALLGAIAPAWLAARRRIARALVPA
jgi:ABC-type lipoprotein release transport system permease subunit